jgi:hypothetical protein
MANLTSTLRPDASEFVPGKTLRADAPEFVPQSSEAKATKQTASKTHYYFLCTSSLLKKAVLVEYAIGKIEIVGNEAILRFRSQQNPQSSDFYNEIKQRIYKTKDQFTNTEVQYFHSGPPSDVKQSVSRVFAHIHSPHSPFNSRICVALGEFCKSFPNMDPKQSEVHFYRGADHWTLNSVLF